jgi:hypothetical protein
MAETLRPFIDDDRTGGAVYVPRGSTAPDFEVELSDGAPRHYDQVAPGDARFEAAREAAQR